jgi:linoleoyl-CoA desaturase
MAVKGSLKFTKGKNEFYSLLKSRIDDYFEKEQISRHANTEMVVKSIVILLAYLTPFAILLTVSLSFAAQLMLWGAMGVAMAGIGMGIMHDAIHGAYSSSKKVNTWMGYTLNVMGGMVYNWKLQHNILHHTYTNIAFMDEDIDPKVGVRFTPHHELRRNHAFQYIYAFFVYSFTTIYWIVAKDVVQFVKYRKNGVNPNTPAQNRSFLLRLVGVKSVYFFIMLGLPTLLTAATFGQVLTGYLLMHFICGVILSVVFQMAHNVEGTTKPLPNDEGTIENNWAIHQMETTCNFSPGNRVLSWYLGGLNYQVEHHLFPRICHVHYPAISKLVKQTAAEFGIPYLENKTFADAFRSHVQTLKKLGLQTPIGEILG